MSTSDSNCKDGASKSNNDDVCDVNDKLQNMSMAEEDNVVSVCVNCGKGEEENHKLKHCNACKMVKYCSRECQIAHRPQHKKACKKHAAKLHDIELFKQPPPQLEDCPICFLLMPSLESGWRYNTCCGKVICSGCGYAPVFDNKGNAVAEKKCPYCRVPYPVSKKEGVERLSKRVDTKDPIAIHNLGVYYSGGLNGYPQDYHKALELFHRSGELGYAESYCNIGYAYDHGKGVEIDKKKANHYYELSAMGGNEVARFNLGNDELRAGNIDRALKHYMIAVRAGDAKSMERIKQIYSYGQATKDDYAKALRSYQTYLGEVKSRQRDEAAAAHDVFKYYE